MSERLVTNPDGSVWIKRDWLNRHHIAVDWPKLPHHKKRIQKVGCHSRADIAGKHERPRTEKNPKGMSWRCGFGLRWGTKLHIWWWRASKPLNMP